MSRCRLTDAGCLCSTSSWTPLWGLHSHLSGLVARILLRILMLLGGAHLCLQHCRSSGCCPCRYQLLYLLDSTPYFSPVLHLLQQHVVRVSGHEMVSPCLLAAGLACFTLPPCAALGSQAGRITICLPQRVILHSTAPPLCNLGVLLCNAAVRNLRLFPCLPRLRCSAASSA